MMQYIYMTDKCPRNWDRTNELYTFVNDDDYKKKKYRKHKSQQQQILLNMYSLNQNVSTSI